MRKKDGGKSERWFWWEYDIQCEWGWWKRTMFCRKISKQSSCTCNIMTFNHFQWPMRQNWIISNTRQTNFRIQWLIPPKTQWILVNLRNFKRDYSETMQLKIKTITKMFQWRSNSKKIIGICATNHPSLVCTAVQCRYWCVLFGFVHSPLDFLSRSFSEVQSGCFGCYSERFQSSNNRNAMESLTNWSVYTLHTNIGSTDLCIRIMTLHLDSLGWLYRDCLSLERESDMHTELYMATYISTPKYDLFK